MNILAIETSTAACSVAVLSHEQCIFLEENTPQAHARHILPMVKQALSDASLTADALDYLAFDQGPGAFTGLRIATAVIQGLALGWDKPVVSVSSLDALSFQAQQRGEPILALLDARMGEIYAGAYLDGVPLAGPAVLPPEQLESWIEAFQIKRAIGLAGDHKPWVAQQGLSWVEAVPRADALATLAAEKITQARKIEEQVPTPLYLRDKVTDKPKKEV